VGRIPVCLGGRHQIRPPEGIFKSGATIAPMKNPTITRLEKLLTVQAERRDKRQRALRSLHQRTRETERQQDGGGQ